MVKSYLRYAPSGCFGVICSNTSNTVYDRSGKLAVAPALEDVIIWHVKQGVQVGSWHDSDNKSNVTVIARCPDSSNANERELYAVGYADGSIRVWNLVNHSCLVTFNGHSSSVSALAFDRSGSLLASGSRDTNIVIWDVMAEVGLSKFRGHKDEITSIHFINCRLDSGNSTGAGATHLLSSSKDTLVKVWDIGTQHCIETIVNHRSEVWSMAVNNDETRLISGSSDSTLRVWHIDKEVLAGKISPLNSGSAAPLAGNNNTDGSSSVADDVPATEQGLKLHGHLERINQDRVNQLQFSPCSRYFACQSTGKAVEIFVCRDDQEMRRRLNRRKKRNRDGNDTSAATLKTTGDTSETVQITASDEFAPFRTVNCSAKVRSFDFAPSKSASNGNNGPVNLLLALNDNSIELKSMSPDQPDVKDICALELQGHRHDIRSLCMSPDDEMLLSCANSSIKIWNVQTKQCMRTLSASTSYALCSAFIPGGRHVVVGTKSGELELYDTWSSTLMEKIKAHDGAVWSIDVRPDKKGLVTGSADKEVKFWDFGAIEDPEYSKVTRRLTLVLARTLQMSDEVLCVKISPNQNLLAVSLLDSTIKVFYFDSLKFFLSLYGHKLPVMCMDISSDNTLLVTGSADKNAKLWGLDFGDCHKSIFAHTDSVMQVRFVPNTHYFFTCSKDRSVKYWDGDKFEQILRLDGHQGEVWAMCLDRWGSVVATAGHDKSIRFWQKTDEQLFLEEEQERDTEEQYEREMIDAQNRNNAGEEDFQLSETAAPHLKTLASLKAGERILEAIDLAESEREKWEAHRKSVSSAISMNQPIPAGPEQNLVLKALEMPGPEWHLLKIIEKIRSAQLDEALLVLPFGKVLTLLQVMEIWVKNRWNIALTTRILVFLLKSHHTQITANRMPVTESVQNSTAQSDGGPQFTSKPLGMLLESIRKELRRSTLDQKEQIGFNLAGLKFVRMLWEQEHVSEFMDLEKEIEGKVAAIGSKKSKKQK